MASSGKQKAWEELGGLDPSEVCNNAAVSFDEKSGLYILKSFCTDFSVNPWERVIKNLAPEGENLIRRYGHFFILSCLWYLVKAKHIPLSGRLIKPENIKGGDMFLRGSHILPLTRIAKKYGDNIEAFIEKGKELCGEKSDYGDASIKLSPLPRIPVVLILWRGDDEFPARAELLLDSTCQLQAPLDIIWSVAMFTVLVLLE
jgi:hypothetical protein